MINYNNIDNIELLRLLLDNNANVNMISPNQSALNVVFRCYQIGDLSYEFKPIELILSKNPKLDFKNFVGNTPIIDFLKGVNKNKGMILYKLVNIFHNKGIIFNQINNNKETALILMYKNIWIIS